jgi:hypothetical protein
MRRMQRILLLATLVAIAPVIAGCENFDPDKLDVFHLNKEKKLPGKRVELFPNGVPGVQQGIPPEYMKGYQQQQAAQAAEGTTTGNAAATPGQAGQQTAAVTPVEQVKPKPKVKAKPKAKHVKRKPKPKPKPKVKTAEPKAETEKVSQPAPQQQQMPPWPSSPPQQQPQTGTSAPWPSQPTATAPWPTAPAPGTFSR